MKRPDTDSLWPWVRYFLEAYLPGHRGSSRNTVESYRTAFRKLLKFVQQRSDRKRAGKLSLAELEPALLLDFLGWLEGAGGQVSPSTRNCRLAALRSFFRCLEFFRPSEEAFRWQRLRQLPFKRAPQRAVDHLEAYELDFVFAQIPAHTSDGFRDLTLLALLYNTGARASEIASVQRAAVTYGRLPAIRLLGKGRRERICPLWTPVASLLQTYLKQHRRTPHTGHDGRIFINQRRTGFTRYGINRIVEKYVGQAVPTCPSLRAKRISAHSFRHTTAIHLLECGADINVIKAWLGHRSAQSTSRYLDLSLEGHRELLERFRPPATVGSIAEIHDAHTPASLSSHADNIDTWLDRL